MDNKKNSLLVQVENAVRVTQSRTFVDFIFPMRVSLGERENKPSLTSLLKVFSFSNDAWIEKKKKKKKKKVHNC